MHHIGFFRKNLYFFRKKSQNFAKLQVWCIDWGCLRDAQSPYEFVGRLRMMIMTVMIFNIMIIISIETIITMVRQHAGSLLPSLPCPRPNIIRGASQL